MIVVGSGLGGLTCANRLAKFGRKVLLVEQHFELGGLAAYFRRKGHIFDVSLHGFPYGMVKTCRKYWTKEIADAIVQIKRIIFDNPQFKIETTFDTEDFTRKLIKDFGVARETTEEFFRFCAGMNFYDDQTTTTREMFERFFPGRSDVVRFLMEPITYANGSTLDEPAITYGIVFSNFMSKGVFTVEGGTDWLIDKMREELERNGCDIMVRATAEKILCENGRVAAVRINGKAVQTKSVVSNGNLPRTVFELIGAENLPADFAQPSAQVRLSTSNCQVFLGIREGETIPDIGDLIFHSTAPEFAPDLYMGKPPVSRSFSIYYPKTRPGVDRYAIVSSLGARYEDWDGLSPEEYKRDKQMLIDNTLDVLESYLPDIRSKVDYAEAATPKTFERYTGHQRGATFGTKFEGLKMSENLPKALGGMFHTGSAAIIMSGWLGAANYGVIVGNNVEQYLDKA